MLTVCSILNTFCIATLVLLSQKGKRFQGYFEAGSHDTLFVSWVLLDQHAAGGCPIQIERVQLLDLYCGLWKSPRHQKRVVATRLYAGSRAGIADGFP